MTDQAATQTDAADDSWMKDLPPDVYTAGQDPARTSAPARKPRAPAKVTPLRPLDQLAGDLDDAPIAGPTTAPRPPVAGPDPEEGAPPKKPARPFGEIWEDCPVKPLGVNGATYYYLDALSQLRAVTKHDAQNIMMLFGRLIPQLCYRFPKWQTDDDGKRYRKPDHFEHQPATVAMIEACSERGLFDPDNAVRGVGAWTDDDGQLIYHLGNRLIVAGEERPPELHQGRIYPAFPPIPHPMAAEKDARDPAADILDTMSTWNWERPDIDPMITLGVIGVQAFGGALDWRPAYWITGGASTGKSALQRLMLHLHGGEKGLMQSADPTARGIAAMLSQSTLPVSLDELEPGDTGSTKERDIIVTARIAASGGRWIRGSSDQKGASGQLRSTFLFSSIIVPGVLKSQDLQRIILLNLHPFAEGAKAPDLRAETWRRRGAALKRQLIDRWPSWSQRLDLWREAFAAQGITGRNADNWATTLAMAQMAHSADLPAQDVLEGWCIKIARHIRATMGEVGNDATEVLTHLLGQMFDPFRRGSQFNLAQWVQVAGEVAGAPNKLVEALSADADPNDLGQQRERAARNANNHLAHMMMRVVKEHDQEARLFVGNMPVEPLKQLFWDSQWKGGAWTQSFSRVPGAQAAKAPRRLAGLSSRGWEIPLSSIPGIMSFPQDAGTVAPVANSAQLPAGMEDF